jgi:hypothetical protein
LMNTDILVDKVGWKSALKIFWIILDWL